jgi:hypothetical protein
MILLLRRDAFILGGATVKEMPCGHFQGAAGLQGRIIIDIDGIVPLRQMAERDGPFHPEVTCTILAKPLLLRSRWLFVFSRSYVSRLTTNS